MSSPTRLISWLLSLILLGGCTMLAKSNAPSPAPQSAEPNLEQGSPIAIEVLPDVVSTQVKTQLREALGATALKIERYSRETWSDGCLGLGGPGEACLAALTEGWQVEVMDTVTGKSYLYRTDLNGSHIRRSASDDR